LRVSDRGSVLKSGSWEEDLVRFIEFLSLGGGIHVLFLLNFVRNTNSRINFLSNICYIG
jgi:hypothetical protein